MASPRPNFLPEVTTLINQLLDLSDAWSSLKSEHDTWAANGIALAQADVDALGIPGLTLQNVTDALVTVQTVVDFIHSTANAPKLYRIKR